MDMIAKRVKDLKPGDDVLHMFGIKRISSTVYHGDDRHVTMRFTDGTWDVLDDFRSLQVPDGLEGETLEEKKFSYYMNIHRSTTLSMAGFPTETILLPEICALLDAYENAFQKMYIEKWGKVPPHGNSLRMETEEETETREAWEAAVTKYWQYVDSQEFDNDQTVSIILEP